MLWRDVEAKFDAGLDVAGAADAKDFDGVAFPGNRVGLQVPKVCCLIDAGEDADQIEGFAFDGDGRGLIIDGLLRMRCIARFSGAEGSQVMRGAHGGLIQTAKLQARNLMDEPSLPTEVAGYRQK